MASKGPHARATTPDRGSAAQSTPQQRRYARGRRQRAVTSAAGRAPLESICRASCRRGSPPATSFASSLPAALCPCELEPSRAFWPPATASATTRRAVPAEGSCPTRRAPCRDRRRPRYPEVRVFMLGWDTDPSAPAAVDLEGFGATPGGAKPIIGFFDATALRALAARAGLARSTPGGEPAAACRGGPQPFFACSSDRAASYSSTGWRPSCPGAVQGPSSRHLEVFSRLLGTPFLPRPPGVLISRTRSAPTGSIASSPPRLPCLNAVSRRARRFHGLPRALWPPLASPPVEEVWRSVWPVPIPVVLAPRSPRRPQHRPPLLPRCGSDTRHGTPGRPSTVRQLARAPETRCISIPVVRCAPEHGPQAGLAVGAGRGAVCGRDRGAAPRPAAGPMTPCRHPTKKSHRFAPVLLPSEKRVALAEGRFR